MSRAVLLMMFFAGVAGAQESRPASAEDGPIAARLGTPFELGYERTASLEGEGLELRFAKVLEDSRCPAGVVCVWAGRVVLLLEVEKAGSEAGEVTLSTMDQADGELPAFGGYAFRLIAVRPAGKGSPELSAPEYSAKLEVTKL